MEHNFDNCHNMTCKNKSQNIGFTKGVNDSLQKMEYILNNFGDHCEEWGTLQDGECKGKSCSDCVLRHAIEVVRGQLN